MTPTLTAFYSCVVASLLSVWLGLPDTITYMIVGIEVGIVIAQILFIIEVVWPAMRAWRRGRR